MQFMRASSPARIAEPKAVPDVDLLALKKSLYARRRAAVVVPCEPAPMKSAKPREHECHINVDRYVLENPGCKSIRGWLVFDFTAMSLIGARPFFRFTSHSVVEAADGRLFDPTPSQASQRYPFLRHEGPEGEFEAIIQAGHIHLDYPV